MADTEPIIKDDPEEGSLSPIAENDQEQDYFEDTGELEMPKDLPQAWMIKVPKVLHENWSQIGDDEPIQLGSVRRYASGKSEVVLSSDGPAGKYHKQVPHKYELREAPRHGNTFIFSEKDIPSHKRKRHYQDNGQSGGAKRQKGRPWRTRSVPKQTRLAAAATHEAQWFPIENEQYRQVTNKRVAADQKGKFDIQVLSGDATTFGDMILGGSRKQKDGGFGNFVGAPPPSKAQKQKDKSHRMERDQLLNLLTEAFREYEYYHIGTLKQRTKQPEAFIRDILKDIAVYVPAGDHAGTFKLNEDMRRVNSVQRQDVAAPKVEGYTSEMDEGSDDDDKVEMEDVKF